MKKINFLLCFFFFFTLCACSQLEEMDVYTDKSSESVTQKSPTHVSEYDAIQIANDVLASMSTRSNSDITPSVDYVLPSSATRSANVPDTLAYVINYPENSGFAIISADYRAEPLLAYSDKGHIDVTDDFVRYTILKPTEEYITYEVNNGTADVPATVNWEISFKYDVVEWMSPVIKFDLHQEAPWNNRVQEVIGANNVAGCVPVASVYIMTHCKPSFTFNGKHYNAAEIVKCIAINQGVAGLGTTTYSYAKAVNEIAQLLLDFGQYIETDYHYNTDTRMFEALANGQKANATLMESSFYSPSQYVSFFYSASEGVYSKLKKLVEDYLKNDCILYLKGINTSYSDYAGHAWVCDGYQYRRLKSLVPTLNPPLPTAYLHANWGSGGECNGYYNTNIYDTPYGNFKITSYCAYEIEK